MKKPAKNLRGPWGLYAIVDPDQCARRPPEELARQVLQNGAGALQLRDKQRSFEDRARLGRHLLALCDEFRVPFIVNDDPHLAREIGADGVHVGQTDTPVSQARQIVGLGRLVGLSTHNRAQALEGQRSGADYLGFGPIYATGTKAQPYAPLGLGEARWAAENLKIPFVAIGGLTPQRAGELARAGVKNVAAISALFAAEDPGAAARAFCEALKKKGPSGPLLREIGEAGALRALRPFVARTGGSLAAGFGDDTAAIRIPGCKDLLLFTADMLVEGVHFLPGPGDWTAVGRKALAVNLSDVAAMGGRPAEALVSIGLPPEFAKADLAALYRGLAYEARRAGARLVGGDTVRAERPTIHVALLGWAARGRPLPLRSRCRPGQGLYLTGTAGDSAAGLALLRDKNLAPLRAEPWAKSLCRRHLLPTARLAAGQALAQAFDDLAMIDVSDDVERECRLLAEASGAALALNVSALPLSAALRRFAAATGQDPRAYALNGGEDFELLFATKASLAEIRARFARKSVRLRVARVGEIRSGPPAVELQGGPSGGPSPFEHFQ